MLRPMSARSPPLESLAVHTRASGDLALNVPTKKKKRPPPQPKPFSGSGAVLQGQKPFHFTTPPFHRERPHQPKPFSGSGAVLQVQKLFYFCTTTFNMELSTDPKLTFVGSIASVICHSDLFAVFVKLSVTLNCPVSPSADGELKSWHVAWP